jgi:mono/diheme cytochrome c family protein
VAIFILINFLMFSGQDSDYTPTTSDPAVVFREVCVECHGKRGEGEGFLYPDLANELIDEEEVIDIVRNGALFMPAFPNIPDSTLKKLAVYIGQKKFLPRRDTELDTEKNL